VVLYFTLAASSGRPENIEVAGSSLFSELDAAALHALATTDMTTECPGARFAIKLRYRLNDENGPPTPPPVVPPPKTSATGDPCKILFLRPANPDDYYPRESNERREKGEVTVRVFPAEKAGPPLDAKVDTSSGFPALDAAGQKTIMNSRFSANCPGLSQLVKVRFLPKP
jgi:TonB family protein